MEVPSNYCRLNKWRARVTKLPSCRRPFNLLVVSCGGWGRIDRSLVLFIIVARWIYAFNIFDLKPDYLRWLPSDTSHFLITIIFIQLLLPRSWPLGACVCFIFVRDREKCLNAHTVSRNGQTRANGKKIIYSNWICISGEQLCELWRCWRCFSRFLAFYMHGEWGEGARK